ncbi:EF-hand domain-containing protein [Kitasatospora sp. NPDC101801]|uniref:EF-hand domain-containing protein n=1 Tax=Kitasatospora sp. NPDC101801 TaxID=3364103 RepID=UPI003829C7E1
MQATANVFAQVARDEDHVSVTAIHEAFEQWWQLLLQHADTDGDGRLSHAEFTTAMADKVTAPEHFESAVMAIADAVMAAADTDVDGVLSLAEYVCLYEALGVPAQTSAPAFARLDLNGDGVISYQEYRAAIVEFCLSTDPDAPGNYLLGPLSLAAEPRAGPARPVKRHPCTRPAEGVICALGRVTRLAPPPRGL